MKTWWLSFCDPSLPSGSQFLGACLVEADDVPLAVEETRRLGINPGGEVLGADFDPTVVGFIPARWKNRLLTKEECAEMDAEIDDAAQGQVAHREPEMQFVCANHNKPGAVGRA